MDVLRINIPSSFVKKDLKFKNEKGAGEAKLFIGSTKKDSEFDMFFNGFHDSNAYLIYRDDILDYLKRTELEYISHKCGEYKNANRGYYDKIVEKISSLNEVIKFTLVKFADKHRIYIRTEGEEKWVFDLIREVALPKITDLLIEKENSEFIFKLKINFDAVCNRENEDILDEIISNDENINKPHQRIFFGAPGTGKSYNLNKEANKYFGYNYDRVTFHPNYMYGNFVGSFKPFPEETGEKHPNGENKKAIIYKYVEGPLMRMFVKAMLNPSTNYLVLIEEINRANVAAVFGDFFQLLDRKNGKSEYPITTSEDVKKYLKDAFEADGVDREVLNYIKNELGENYEHLILPPNLYIWATMNSADQGVMPMDTAFKRRWDFNYIGVNDALEDEKTREEFKNYKFKINDDEVATWDSFRREVNSVLSSCRVAEDKLLGPYFISKVILESEDIEDLTENIKNKVLMYLYEDAGKAHRSTIFNMDKAGTFSELCSNFMKNAKSVFKATFDKLEVEENDSTYKHSSNVSSLSVSENSNLVEYSQISSKDKADKVAEEIENSYEDK